MENEKLYGNDNFEGTEIETDFGDTADEDIFIFLDDDDDVKIAGAPGASKPAAEAHKGLYANDVFYGDDLDKDENDKTNAPKAVTPKNEVNKNFDEQFFGSVYNERKTTVKNVLLIVLFVILLVGLVIFAGAYVKKNLFNSKTVYEGVKINGYDLGGMTEKQVSEYVTKTYFDPIKNANITVVLGDERSTYPLTDFVNCPDADEIAKQAYEIGRNGTESERVDAIRALRKNGKSVDVQYEIVTTKLSTIIDDAKDNGFEEVVNPTFSLRDDVISFTSGRKGFEADISKFKSDLNDVLVKFENAITNIENESKLSDETIVIELVETDFKKLDADAIYNAAMREAISASFVRNGTLLTDSITIDEGISARSINRENLEKIVERINSGDTTPYFMLQYDFTDPKEGAEALRELLFANTLASVTSENKDDLYSDDKAAEKALRAKNITKCAALFKEIQLLDGESVNLAAFIGENTAANGFVEAIDNVQDGGKKTFAAGVNQFVSAVFEAAFKAGLGVNNVTHNAYLPLYGAPGMDAVYDSENGLSIKNTTGNPVKISCEFKNDTITVTILGTKTATCPAPVKALISEEQENGKHIIRTFAVTRGQGVIDDTYNVSYILFDGVEQPQETSDDPSVTPEPSDPTSSGDVPSTDTPAPSSETPGTPEDTPSPSTETPPTTMEPTETPIPEV